MLFNSNKLSYTLGSMTYARFTQLISKHFPFIFEIIILKLIKLLSVHYPPQLIKFMPPVLCNLLGQIAFIQGKPKEVNILWFRRAQKSKKSMKLGFGLEAGQHINFPNNIDGNQKFVLDRIEKDISPIELFDIIRSYSFWNLDFKRNLNCLSELKDKIEVIDNNSSSLDSDRYLPEFTTNMGHLGFLYFYICFYNRANELRTVHLWPDVAPNKLFLDKVLSVANFDIIMERGPVPKYFNSLLNCDNLLFSRETKGLWRFEINTSAYSPQNFPELYSKSRPLLKMETKELEEGYSKLKSIGMDPNRWIVTLHIREPKNGNSRYNWQSRDSSILDYRQFCEVIRDLGGQVIRMGDDRFPELPKNFPALDYANSAVRSELLDMWLWSQALWSTVNPNGAMIPPMTFGTPRLITNQWFWDITGDEKDMFIPKLLFSGEQNRLLRINEVFNHPLSRAMDKNLFRNINIEILDNSSVILRDAALDFYKNLKLEGEVKKNRLSKEFELILGNKSENNFISVPDSFSEEYFEKICIK